MCRRGATSRSTPAWCFTVRVVDSPAVVKLTCRIAGVPLASTAASSPHRCSATTPGRAI
jgi:hypothetical protein